MEPNSYEAPQEEGHACRLKMRRPEAGLVFWYATLSRSRYGTVLLAIVEVAVLVAVVLILADLLYVEWQPARE